MNVATLFLIGPWLLLAGVLLTKLSRRLNFPALLFFIVIGMLAGSEGLGGIAFEDYAFTRDVGLVALALILFAAGLATGPRAFGLAVRSAASLATLGVVLTALITAAFAWWWLGWSFLEGVLLGSIVASTDAAAVFLVLRHQNVRLPRSVEAVLEVESGINDPMSVFLTLAVTTALATGHGLPAASVARDFVIQMGAGALIGTGFGAGAAWLLNRVRLASTGLYPVLTLAVGLGTFSLTNAVGGSGFLAVYLAGLMIGGRLAVLQRLVVDFHDAVAWLMQIVMFVVLGLLSFPSRVWSAADQGLILSAVVIVIARPVAVFVSLLASRLSVRERLLVSWVGLRGAVPIILAMFPVLAGLPNAPVIFNLIFFVVVTSTLLQGTTVSWAAHLLGLRTRRDPEPSHRLHITSIQQTDRHIVDFYLEPSSPAVGQRIKELDLPPETFIAMLVRDGEVLPPQGHTQLANGDHLFVLCRLHDRIALVRLFRRSGETRAGASL